MSLKKFVKKKILSFKKEDRPIIIGIDGPTAAGKTYLSKDLKSLLKSNFNSIWICQLDWTLKSRKYRSDSLKFFKKQNIKFHYESQDHMDLDQIIKCLKRINNQKRFQLDKKGQQLRQKSIKKIGLIVASEIITPIFLKWVH